MHAYTVYISMPHPLPMDTTYTASYDVSGSKHI